MVNSDSPIYGFSEKVGLVIGKGIIYIVVAGIAIFIGGKFGASTPAPRAL